MRITGVSQKGLSPASGVHLVLFIRSHSRVIYMYNMNYNQISFWLLKHLYIELPIQ